MIKESINEQELLDICLTLAALDGEGDEYFAGPAGKVITHYSIIELTKEKERAGEEQEITEEEICDKINSLVIGKVLENMTKKNLVKVDFSGDEVMYGLDQAGIDYLESRRNND